MGRSLSKNHQHHAQSVLIKKALRINLAPSNLSQDLRWINYISNL